MRRVVRDLSARYHVDIAAFCDELCMTWDELGELAADPLVTIGAHTVNHVMLRKVPEKAARTEMEMSRSVIEASLGVRPAASLLSGRRPTSAGPREFRIAAELGFKTAVTTRPGVLFPAAPRASDRAAAHLAQRRIPAVALRQGAALGRRHRGVERVPPGRRASLSLLIAAATSSSSAASPAAPSRARRPRNRSPRPSRCLIARTTARTPSRAAPRHDQHEQRDGSDELAQADRHGWLSVAFRLRGRRRVTIWSAPSPASQ